MTRSKLFVPGALFLISVCGKLAAQEFLNRDLLGPSTVTSLLPQNWQSVPFTDVGCQATYGWTATPDVTTYNAPDSINGIVGNPYSGTTFLSGLHGHWGSITFHEGIMQTVSGFVPATNYTVHFHQAVSKQNNCVDSSGGWAVYIDNTLAGISASTFNGLPPGSTSFVWELRTISFTASATAHTIKFLPMDDDLNMQNPHTVRMGIDCIYLSEPCDSVTQVGIGDHFSATTLSLYPNPATDAVTIRYNGNEPLEVTLYDPAGKMIRNQPAENGTVISVSDLASGIYFYRIREKSGKTSKGKLIRL